MTAAKVQEMPKHAPAGMTVRSIPREALHAAHWNARTNFADEAMDELKASIAQHGILVPLIVRPIDRPASIARYEIVAGHRRYLASPQLPELPCDVRELSDAEAREVGLIDNLQRQDLSALEEAEAYQQMFRLAGDSGRPLTPAELAARVGKSEGYVRLRLRLLAADAGVRDALREGRILLGHALELARLESPAQKTLLKWLLFHDYLGSKAVRKDSPSVAELKRHIAEEILLDLAKAPFDTKDAQLVPAAGSCLDCPKRTGNNKLLFADVKQGDTCTDPACFAGKVTRSIDVTLSQLTAKGEKVVRISENYDRAPKGALATGQYNSLRHSSRSGEKCDAGATGIYVDGRDRGKTIAICLDGKCKVHSYFAAGSGGDSPELKATRAKARQEKACRMRMLQAAIDRSAKWVAPGAAVHAQLYELAAYAIDRGDNNGVVTLLNLLGWPKTFAGHDGRKALLQKLASLPVARAAAIGMLASVAHLLTVSEYSITKPERLEEVVGSLGVDVAAVRKAVAAEFAAKGKKPAAKKAVAKKATKKAAAKRPVLSGAARAKIAAAQKARWVKAKKAGRS
jgi:ParB family chromosome partitioning protein